MENIIVSVLDDDIYKFTMQQVFFFNNPNVVGKYKFICRTPKIDFTECYETILEQLEAASELTLTRGEIDYMSKFEFFRKPYIRFLEGFKLDFRDLTLNLDKKGNLSIIVEGPIIYAMMWEMKILSIVNEVYFRFKTEENNLSYDIGHMNNLSEGRKRLNAKLELIKEMNAMYGYRFKFLEFGTRRRYCFRWHDEVVKTIKNAFIASPANYMDPFIGTSNVYLAKEHNIKCSGTQAHEYQQTHLGLTTIDKALPNALNQWIDFYGDQLGICLTDTFTTPYFLKHFDKRLATAYNGIRQDSGDPMHWADMVIKHYMKLGIDNKTLVFSDSLDIHKAFKILDKIDDMNKYCVTKFKAVFGIGTHWTNDVGFDPLNIVVKMIECNGLPVIKISDNYGKTICENNKFAEYALDYFTKGGK